MDEVCYLDTAAFTRVSSLRGFLQADWQITAFRLSYFKGVTKRYSATLDSCCGEKLLWNKRRVVSFFGRVKKNRQQWWRCINPLFGQNQQADSCNSGIPFRELCTTKVAHAFFNFCTGVSSAIRGCTGLPSYISYSPHNYTHRLSGRSASVHYQGVNE